MSKEISEVMETHSNNLQVEQVKYTKALLNRLAEFLLTYEQFLETKKDKRMLRQIASDLKRLV